MNYETIEAMAQLLRESPKLVEVEWTQGDATIRLRRPASPARKNRQTKPATSSNEKSQNATPSAVPAHTVVTATLVGIYHPLPEPVQVGDRVKENQTMGQIEAMRLLNDCRAPVTGTVHTILVQDGQPVQYGQPLFEIEEAR